jgi:hypothetical protein
MNTLYPTDPVHLVRTPWEEITLTVVPLTVRFILGRIYRREETGLKGVSDPVLS